MKALIVHSVSRSSAAWFGPGRSSLGPGRLDWVADGSVDGQQRPRGASSNSDGDCGGRGEVHWIEGHLLVVGGCSHCGSSSWTMGASLQVRRVSDGC